MLNDEYISVIDWNKDVSLQGKADKRFVLDDTGELLNGKYFLVDEEIYVILENGKLHCLTSPSVFGKKGDYKWFINGNYIKRIDIVNWLTENDIPLDWNSWTDSDKMMFALHWSDYNGT